MCQVLPWRGGCEVRRRRERIARRVFIYKSIKNRHRTTTVATKQQERSPEITPVQQNKPNATQTNDSYTSNPAQNLEGRARLNTPLIPKLDQGEQQDRQNQIKKERDR
jgi:hypothetical protein